MRIENSYNPDVLVCLANLSNDEVFTPPAVVNQMLDLLPAKLWRDKAATFLDPACKSGVFLREIAKRLLEGLYRTEKQHLTILRGMPSRPGEFHPETLTEPYVIVSHHTARLGI